MDTKLDYFTRRKKDEIGEKSVAEFLDRYFYSAWATDITRNTERETQIKGIDLTVTGATGEKYVIDEKAAVGYANKPLKTFAHEITSINIRGNEYKGWLVENTLNDFYVYVWITECKTTGEVMNADDIISADVALINKQDLYNWFKSKKLYGTELFEKSRELRETVFKYGISDYWNYCSNCNNKSLNDNGYKFHINPNTHEQSVNILISKDILIDIATYAVNIRNGVITELTKKQNL